MITEQVKPAPSKFMVNVEIELTFYIKKFSMR